MAEATTIARPYAEAAFRIADKAGRLSEWSRLLAAMADVAANPEMRSLIGNPKVSADQLVELFISLAPAGAGAEAKNFLQLLVDNGRLQVLPQMHELFDQLMNERQGVVDAHIFSAFPLDDGQKAGIVADLERRFKRKVNAQVLVDETLIGGVKITVGDQVLDGSVRAKLAEMARVLTY